MHINHKVPYHTNKLSRLNTQIICNANSTIFFLNFPFETAVINNISCLINHISKHTHYAPGTERKTNIAIYACVTFDISKIVLF